VTVCFVTGTDTGVGKTVVTAALAVILRARGRNVAVVKSAQTGVRPGEAGDGCRLAGIRRAKRRRRPCGEP
jgi:dethiobiotin synthetase